MDTINSSWKRPKFNFFEFVSSSPDSYIYITKYLKYIFAETMKN